MPNSVSVREIDPESASEINTVAERMRATLIEVEGEKAGTALYSMEWLVDRVRWHINNPSVPAKVYLAVDSSGGIVGHTIVRREVDDVGIPYGLFSTTYVIPAARRLGVAEKLLLVGEDWMKRQSLTSSTTWTSSTNVKLIGLYAKHGYVRTATHIHDVTRTQMVKLERRFECPTATQTA